MLLQGPEINNMTRQSRVSSNEIFFSLSIHFPHKRRPSWLYKHALIEPQSHTFNPARKICVQMENFHPTSIFISRWDLT